MSQRRTAMLDVINTRGLTPTEDDEFVGSQSTLDLPHVLDRGNYLKLAANLLTEWIELHVSVPITAVGGPESAATLILPLATRGLVNYKWFTVSSRLQRHDANPIVGAEPIDTDDVVLIDGVVTTGATLRFAYDCVIESGAAVKAVIPLVDLGTMASGFFESVGIGYWPVFTHRDLDMAPVSLSGAEEGL